MQKLDHPPATTIFPAARLTDDSLHQDSGLDTGRRLLVIVSDSEMDTPATARRILEVAQAFESRVLFLGLTTDRLQESSLRRQLITLSTMVRDANLPFELKIETGRDWLDLIKSHWHEGDVLVCLAGQRAGTRRTMLGPLLQTNFSSTVYVINEPVQPERTRADWISPAVGWVGSISIILGFFWLQVRMDQLTRDWLNSVLLIISILVEVWLVWIWNSLFG
jgi:hypothetical protein